MKVIVVDNSLDVTGAFRAVFNNIVGETNGLEFIYFIPSGSRNKDLLRSKGISVYTFTSYELSRSIKNMLLYLPFLFWNGFRLARIVRHHKASIIYQNEIFILSGLVARLFVKVRVFTHIRVMPTIFPRRLYRVWLQLHDQFAHRLLTVSFACKEAAHKVYHTKRDIDVLYDFVLPAEKSGSFIVRNTEASAGLLFLGNYTRGKGQDLALKAVKIFQNRYPQYDLKIRMYGSDFGYPPNVAFRKELEQWVRENGLQESVEIHPFAHDIERVIKENDLLLNLSVAESFSFVVAEAMSFGIPVLATNSGGPGELIAHGQAGELVPAEPSAIADRIAYLLQHRALREAYSANEKNRIASLVQQYGGVGRFLALFHQ